MKTRARRLAALLLAPFTLSLATLGAPPPSSPWLLGLDELARPDRLPAFKRSLQTAAISSYDRTGGNDDGFSGKYSAVRKDAEGVILADLQGPGIVHRLWTPTPTDELMEFFFDGESAPRIQVKFRALFLGDHPDFPRPLVGYGVGGFYSYVPLPFAKSLVIRVRAPKIQFYQINYSTYPPEAPVTSYDPNLPPAVRAARDQVAQLWNAAGTDLSRAVTPPDARTTRSRTTVTLPPGATKTLFKSSKPGRIVGLRISPASALAGKARDLTLRLAFDGATPAVDCPAGDFFGYAWGQPAMQSLFLGAQDNTAYCYFPMPFDRSARVDLVSARATPVELTAEVVFCPVPRAADEGRFAALWHRENPTRDNAPFTFADLQGRGHLVACILQAQGFESGKTLFFEGDDQTTLDGTLAIHGTGSEDFFNGGWYDVPDRWEKRLSRPLSGCLGYQKHLGRTGGYRLLLGEAYAYRQSLRHTIEHAGEKNSIPTDYAGLTCLYTDAPIPASPPCSPTDLAVVDLDEIIFPAWWQIPIHAFPFDRATITRKLEKLGSEDVRFLAFTGGGPDWVGPAYLALTIDVPRTGPYDVAIDAVRGPNQGAVQLFRDEIPVAPPVPLLAESRSRAQRVALGRLHLDEGANNLMLKLVDKPATTDTYALDLIQVLCTRVRQP